MYRFGESAKFLIFEHGCEAAKIRGGGNATRRRAPNFALLRDTITAMEAGN